MGANHAHPSPAPALTCLVFVYAVKNGGLSEQGGGGDDEGDDKGEPGVHAEGPGNAGQPNQKSLLTPASQFLSLSSGGKAAPDADSNEREDTGPAAGHGERKTVLVGRLLHTCFSGPYPRV